MKIKLNHTPTATFPCTHIYLNPLQVISRVDRDLATLNLRVEIDLDPTLWAAWDKMGYVLHPTMLDGVLQIFIVYIMEASDITGVPQMINDLVLVRKPTS